jgi:hypothetical protein
MYLLAPINERTIRLGLYSVCMNCSRKLVKNRTVIIRSTQPWDLFKVIVGLLCIGTLAQASQIALFTENGTQPNDFTFANNENMFQFGTIAGGVPVNFAFAGGLGVFAGEQAGTLTIAGGRSITPGSFVPDGYVSQPMDGDMTIAITRNFDSANLLTIFYHFTSGAPAIITGADGGSGASWGASTQANDLTKITFTSAFLNFQGGTSNAAAMSFSSVLPSLQVGSDSNCPASAGHNGAMFLCSFTSAGMGTFSGNLANTPIPPEASNTTEPGTFLIFSSGLIAVSLLSRRMFRR